MMLRILEDRCWLTDRHHLPTTPLSVCTPTELVTRQAELQQLLETAPADQREFIDRITNSALDPTQMHQYLSSATSTQNGRRDWIIANWPHIVELEQITQLLASQPAIDHRPQEVPDPVRTMLDQLRHYAPDITAREERTLDELARQATDDDPVRRLEARQQHLRQLSRDTMSPTEQDALDQQLATVSIELRNARRAETAEQAFNRYSESPTDQARTTRITTLAHDALTDPPTWVIDHVRHLNDHGQLTSTDTAQIATRIITAAAHLDIHSQLPPAWPASPAPTFAVAERGIEVG